MPYTIIKRAIERRESLSGKYELYIRPGWNMLVEISIIRAATSH
jgi:hypothetical protein